MFANRSISAANGRTAQPTSGAGDGDQTVAGARRRWLARIGCAASLLVGLLVAVAPTPVVAHAGLVDTDPLSGASYSVDERPTAVMLVFTESVSNPGDAIVVLDSSGRTVDDGPEHIDGGVVTQPLVALDEDVYTVVYHIVSADGHPVRGAYVFTYGTPAVGAAAAAGELADAQTAANGRVALLRLLVSIAENVLVLVAAGAAAAWLVFRLLDRRTLAMTTALAIGAALAATGGVAVSLADAGWGAFEQRDTLAALVRVTGALVVAVAAHAGRRRLAAAGSSGALWRPGAVLALVGGVAILATYATTGHGFSHGNSAVNAVALSVHLAAGAIWLGAAPVLAVALGSRSSVDDPARDDELTAVMRRFSSVAGVALPVVVAAGGLLSFVYTGGAPSFGYGAILAAKTLLVASVAVLGLKARRTLRTAQPLPVLRRTMAVEAVVVVAVAAFSAGLVTMAPSSDGHGGHRDHAQHIHDDPDAPEATGCDVELDGRTISVDWDGTGPGRADVHLYATGGDGGEMRVLAAHERLGEARLEYDLVRFNAVHWMGPIDLPFAGTWTLTLEERPDRFTVTQASCSITVPG